MTPVPVELLHQDATQKVKRKRKGKNNGYFKMISKIRKQRRVDNYAAVYSLPIKQSLSPRSPREKVAEAMYKLKQLEIAKMRESTAMDTYTENFGKEKQGGSEGILEKMLPADPTVSLYRKAWLLRQQQQQKDKLRLRK